MFNLYQFSEAQIYLPRQDFFVQFNCFLGFSQDKCYPSLFRKQCASDAFCLANTFIKYVEIKCMMHEDIKYSEHFHKIS